MTTWKFDFFFRKDTPNWDLCGFIRKETGNVAAMWYVYCLEEYWELGFMFCPEEYREWSFMWFCPEEYWKWGFMWFCPEGYWERGLRGFIRKDIGNVFYVVLSGRILRMGFMWFPLDGYREWGFMWSYLEGHRQWGVRGFIRKDTGNVVLSERILRIGFYVVLFRRIAGKGFLFGFF